MSRRHCLGTGRCSANGAGAARRAPCGSITISTVDAETAEQRSVRRRLRPRVHGYLRYPPAIIFGVFFCAKASARGPRTSRFGSPLVLNRVHWVRPELVAEVKFLTWTDDNLLRQVVYEGLCEDKPAAGVRHPVPHSSR